MPKRIDEIGNRHGNLVVNECKGKNKHGVYLWLCRCDCGNKTIVSGRELRSGKTKGCGCLRGRRLPKGQATFNKMFYHIKAGAKQRGHSFDLSKEQVKKLTKQKCVYCGIIPSTIASWKGLNGDYIYNGIDRVDNDNGYSIDNVVPCCKICNQAKHTMKVFDFKEWINRLVLYNQIQINALREV